MPATRPPRSNVNVNAIELIVDALSPVLTNERVAVVLAVCALLELPLAVDPNLKRTWEQG